MGSFISQSVKQLMVGAIAGYMFPYITLPLLAFALYVEARGWDMTQFIPESLLMTWQRRFQRASPPPEEWRAPPLDEGFFRN
jgi:hypothetical protein